MSDHIHILGICGTFMAGLALLARESGFSVTGSDRNIYPPMSTQLLNSDIPLVDGYDAEQLSPAPGCVVVGNALSRGQPVVEAMLNSGIPYTSGPEWLGRHILQNQWVLAVSGTHGKTSTASMLAWILEQAGLQPGFLIGGIPINFGLSARLGGGDFFVVEADEYDSAFFDKRSKFVHYRPKTAVINNLEYDHADIFPDLAAIETQFHHLVRCIPGDGLIVRGGGQAIDRVLDKGCWTPVETVADAHDEQHAGWTWRALSSAADALHIAGPDGSEAELRWALIGSHNAANATAAIAAACKGLPPEMGYALAAVRVAVLEDRLPLLSLLQVDPLQLQSSHLTFQEYYAARSICAGTRLPGLPPWQWPAWWANTLTIGADMSASFGGSLLDAAGVTRWCWLMWLVEAFVEVMVAVLGEVWSRYALT